MSKRLDNTDTVTVLQETIDLTDEVSTAHISSTAAHGATGAVVGTTNAQTLSNKTFRSQVSISGTAGGLTSIYCTATTVGITHGADEFDLPNGKSGTLAVTSDIPSTASFATLTGAETLTNKTIRDTENSLTISHFGLLNKGVYTHAELDTHYASSASVHGLSGTVVGTTDTQTLSAKTLDATCVVDHVNLSNKGTNTHAQIDTAITASTSHIAATAAHGATGAVVGTTNTQTLTNKTLTAPVIASVISNGNTVTFPTTTQTLVGRTTTDTMTGKTISFPTTGGTPAALNYYELLDSAITITGSIAPLGAGQNLTRIGRIVYLRISGAFDVLTSAVVAPLTVTEILPARFRPAVENRFAIPVINAGFNDAMAGCLSVSSAGVLVLYGSLAQGGFTGIIGDIVGVQADLCVSWTI